MREERDEKCRPILTPTEETQLQRRLINVRRKRSSATCKMDTLTDWINRGEGGHFVIKRLTTDPMIPQPMLDDLRRIAESYIGKSYDLYFDWSDDKIYCSELVWKSFYKMNNFELGDLQKLSDFDLRNEVVKKKMQERYGDKILMDEIVISPAAIFNSGLLKTVKSN